MAYNSDESNSTLRRQAKSMMEKLEKEVSTFFDTVKNISKKFSNANSDTLASIDYMVNFNSFTKVQLLFDEFETFDQKSTEAFASIKKYLDTINACFQDTGKKLNFSEKTGELYFDQLDKAGNHLGTNRNLRSLSSGEKQLLILFTYLSFNQDEDKIFIIDEPELSLHPKWQEEFLPSVKKLMPSTAQIICATHSPSLVGNFVDQCHVLLPYS